MKTLVTGGAGFIGSHLVGSLIDRGDEVLIVDDLSTGREANLAPALEAGARFEQGDVSERDFVERVVGGFEPERAFHLAAQADVRRAVADPGFDARVNVIGTVNVLEAMRAQGAAPVVFAATGGVVYGEGEGTDLPFPETAPAAPETAYGASKLAGEVYIGLYRRLHGTPGVALRFANVYGPRQDPHGEAGVVAIFCGKLLDGEMPTIFGNGQQTRDYVYVEDAVAAMLTAADALGERGTTIEGPFNIGTGRETSVLSLLESLSGMAGLDVEPEFAPERTGEIKRVSIDPSAAGSEFGWRAQVDLDDGLARTLAAVEHERAPGG